MDKLESVKKIVETEIKPALASHHGDIQVMGLEDNYLKVKLLGACSGCPQADLSTKAFMETTLKNHFTWLEGVTVVQEVSPELIDFAKAILSGKVGKA
jgi:Fe-S cluster biogenesis protein NfuA